MLVRQPLNRAKVTLVTAATVLGIAMAGCSGSFADNNSDAAQGAASSPPPAVATASPRNVAAALPDFAALVEHYGAAVVNVAVVGCGYSAPVLAGLHVSFSTRRPYVCNAP